jgi:hypothetical protein
VRPPNGQRQTQTHLCYCPAAVLALTQAADELTKARTELHRHDPNWNAIAALERSTDELKRAREILQAVSRRPELDGQARELIGRFTEAMPMVDRIEDIVATLDRSEVVWLRR